MYIYTVASVIYLATCSIWATTFPPVAGRKPPIDMWTYATCKALHWKYIYIYIYIYYTHNLMYITIIIDYYHNYHCWYYYHKGFSYTVLYYWGCSSPNSGLLFPAIQARHCVIASRRRMYGDQLLESGDDRFVGSAWRRC